MVDSRIIYRFQQLSLCHVMLEEHFPAPLLLLHILIFWILAVSKQNLAYLTAYWIIFTCFLAPSDNHFQTPFFFEIFFSEYNHCQAVWTQIRPDFLSGLVWSNQFAKVIGKE